MVREDALRDPLAPELLRAPQLVGGRLPGGRRGQRRPGQRDVGLVAVDHAGAGRRRPPVDAQPQAADVSRSVGPRALGRSRVDGVVAGAVVLPAAPRRGRSRATGRTPPARSTVPLTHVTVRSRMCSASSSVGVRRCVADRSSWLCHGPMTIASRTIEPAGRRLPGGLQDQGAGQVAAGRRDADAVRADAERAGAAVEDRREDAGRVRPRDAHPLDGAGGRDQAVRLAVGQERVARDRRERRAVGAVGVRGGAGDGGARRGRGGRRHGSA